DPALLRHALAPLLHRLAAAEEAILHIGVAIASQLGGQLALQELAHFLSPGRLHRSVLEVHLAPCPRCGAPNLIRTRFMVTQRGDKSATAYTLRQSVIGSRQWAVGNYPAVLDCPLPGGQSRPRR